MKVVVHDIDFSGEQEDRTYSFSPAEARVVRNAPRSGDLEIIRDKKVVGYFARSNWDWYEVVDE